MIMTKQYFTYLPNSGQNLTWVISTITAVLVALVALSALALSYNALQAVAVANGVTGWQSYIWPLLIDASLVVFSLAVVRNSLWSERIVWPWLLVGVYTVATVVFKVPLKRKSKFFLNE